MLSWLSFLPKLAGWAIDWWTKRQADKHDADVRRSQQTEDALQGTSDAIKQVDRVADAVDAGGVRIADDPPNRNR